VAASPAGTPGVRTATLQVYGELLLNVGNAFLRQRYAAVLDQRLGQTNLRLSLLLDAVKGHALFTVNGNGLVTSWNGGAERLFGYTETDVIGQNFSRFFTPEDIEAHLPAKLVEQASLDGAIEDRGWQVRKDGTRFYAEGSLSKLGKGGSREFGRLALDLTERRNSEEALRHTQKLESIGVLASGIAHDFNNLLTVILSGASFAIATLPPDHPAGPSLAIAVEAGEKAADLTHQLLAYAGQGKFVVTRFDLSALIRDMLKLLHSSIPKSVELQIALEADLPWIEADASQIRQIVMNLVINGAESIGPGGGSVRVSTGTTAVHKPAGSKAGIEVWMEVQDSGSGMTDATKARIFDPFFTTKFTGRGLGLAAVSGIVRGHAGRMLVESALGKGSTFRICFPSMGRLVQKKEEKPTVAVVDDLRGTVLVVDDEPALRIMAQTILEHSGFKILLAANGRDAIEVFRQNAGTITAILLDMTMPVMGGEEAFHLIREIRADVPIVVATGYSETATRDLFAAGTAVSFVQKPYTAARLIETMRTISQAARAARVDK
jgi:two-component system, chemotaxis family, CheB/CheR fusion protein